MSQLRCGSGVAGSLVLKGEYFSTVKQNSILLCQHTPAVPLLDFVTAADLFKCVCIVLGSVWVDL